MIQLTEVQRKVIQQGNPIRVSVPEIGKDCVVILADAFDDMRNLPQDDGPTMQEVAALIERNMSEDDANDPLLASYQDTES